MKKNIFLFLVIQILSQNLFAQDLKSFLRACGWGVVGGATAGVASLAFSDKPNESWGNVAKGASLGLYAGMAYGFMHIQDDNQKNGDYVLIPKFREGKLAEIQVSATILSF